MSETDRIEREIAIAAPLARVWQLVAEPGWWIGDDNRSAWRRWREGDLDIVEEPRIGRFPVRTVALEPQHHASFRWAFAYPGERPDDENSSLVEFWLREHEGGTLVRVVESGFDALRAAAAKRDQTIDQAGNVKGWGIELDFLKADAERIAS
jgi:uncharacterized protein YndB with AHSA1/START domain